MKPAGPRPTVAIVAGARPNFMKVAPVLRAVAARDYGFDVILVQCLLSDRIARTKTIA